MTYKIQDLQKLMRQHTRLKHLVIAQLIVIAWLFSFNTYAHDQNTEPVEDIQENIGIDGNAQNISSKTDPRVQISDEMVTFSGIADERVTGASRISLTNENQSFYIQFTLTENDTVIYESKLVEPGKELLCRVDSLIDSGEHTLVMTQTPYKLVDGKFIPYTYWKCTFVLTRVD